MLNDLSARPLPSISFQLWAMAWSLTYLLVLSAIKCYLIWAKNCRYACQTGLTSPLLHTCLADSMASDDITDYKTLLLEAEEWWKQAEEEQRREAGLRRRAEERTWWMTFDELIRYGHNIVARSLRVANQSRCTSGRISAPIGKKCQNCAHGRNVKLSRRTYIALFASILDQYKKQPLGFSHPSMRWSMTDKKSKRGW